MTTEERSTRVGGIFAAIKNTVADAIGSTRTRVDHFTADVEHRLFRLIAMLMWSAIAFVCLSLGLGLAVLTIIFGFNLPPKYAFGIPALVFLGVGTLAIFMFRCRKASKPKPASKRHDS
jgi:uncharacterized membrane protein YqjE